MNIVYALPPIAIGSDDFQRLAWLADAASMTQPSIAAFLRRELARADHVEPWFGLVTMGSLVRVREDVNGAARSVRLVYPVELGRHEDGISILSELGVALIGLREGQSIRWRSAERGRLRAVTVLRSD